MNNDKYLIAPRKHSDASFADRLAGNMNMVLGLLLYLFKAVGQCDRTC